MANRVITTSSPDETKLLGVRLAASLETGQVIGLIGPLGAGKTVLAKGICEGLGFEGIVTSPSYSLLNIYRARMPIYHFDLYRLENAEDLDDIGFAEYLFTGRGISIVEWADRIPGALPQESLILGLSILGESDRKVTICLPANCASRIGQSI